MTGEQTPQNLVRRVTAEEVVRPAGYYQSFVLDGLGIASAACAGYLYHLYLNGGVLPLFVVLGAGLFALLSVFGMILGKSFGRRTVVILLEGIALVSSFGSSLSLRSLVLVALVAAAFLLWGEALSRREAGATLDIRFFKMTKPLMRKTVTGLVLAGVLLYLPQWDAEKSFFSQSSFSGLFDWSAGIGGKLYPEVSFNASVETFARSVARSELRSSQIFRGLAPAAQESLVRSSADQIIANLGRILKTGVASQEPLSAFFYRILGDWYDRAAKSLGGQFVIVWAVAAFLVARGIGVPLYWLISFVAFFVYQILLATNALAVVGESRVHEVIEYT